VKYSDQVKGSFDEYAEGFLFEQCRLVWSLQKTTLGQGGEVMEFPAYELEMTGTDFTSPVRRTGPDQVSESQREFIDLAFRMALISTGAEGGVGSLVIDAPESSLDAVFVTRAARVLGRFAEPSRANRLIVTSNLIEGRLIPALLAAGGASDDPGASRVVDLLTLAAPTAAVKQLSGEYAEVRDELLAKPREEP
jgi:hypothetical protein